VYNSTLLDLSNVCGANTDITARPRLKLKKSKVLNVV
jgi:hypothetical protein